MNMLATEFQELRQMLRDFKDGTLDAVDLDAMLGIYGQTEKRMRIYLQGLVQAGRLGQDYDVDILQEIVGRGELRVRIKK